jgi:trigger factor
VEFEVRPEVQVERVGGFTVTRPANEVTDEDVDNVIERLRDDRAEWKLLEEGATPDLGDRVTVEIEVLESELDEDKSGEPRTYRFVLGEGQAIPNVEESILSLKQGGTGEFSVAFPDDFPEETRRGQRQKLRITLSEVHRKELPAADDELARAVGDFENVAALRDRVLEDLKEDAVRRTDSEVRRQLLDQIIQANDFELPSSMVERYLDHMTGHSHADGEGEKHHHTPEEETRIEQIRSVLRPEAEWSIKRMIIVDRIAEQRNLVATQDEIDARISSLAQQHGRSESDVWLQLEKTGQLETLEREITESKVFEFLQAENTVVE